MKKERKISKARTVAFYGILFALSMVLSLLEGLFPLDFLIPGVKLGFSNIIVMYALFFLGVKSAYLLSVLKSVFVLMTRGSVLTFALSLSGGLLSITMIFIVMKLFKRFQPSYMVLSIVGASSHNLGQILMFLFLYGVQNIMSYRIPILILMIMGALMGVVTSMILQVVLPVLQKMGMVVSGKKLDNGENSMIE